MALHIFKQIFAQYGWSDGLNSQEAVRCLRKNIVLHFLGAAVQPLLCLTVAAGFSCITSRPFIIADVDRTRARQVTT